jgi:probable phosphoglycerate mutase
MKVYFARHGKTNYNDLRLCNADPSVDVHLTERGIEQAKALAKELKQAPLEHIFISELQRTRQTAEIINVFHNSPIEVNPLLNDHRSGYEGKPARLLRHALDASEDRWTARFNGGESTNEEF